MTGSPPPQPSPARGEGVLVTGAGGFVGRAVVGHLQDAGFRVEACDLQGASRAVNVLDKQAMMEVALETRPHTLIHAAALTSGTDLQLLEVNVQGTLNALEAAKSAGVQHFILFSSCGVYAPQAEPISEDGITTTAHAYGLSKLLAEQVCTVGKSAEMTVWILRIGAVYGAGEQPSTTRQRASLIYEISQAILSQKPTQLPRASSDIHNWLHTRDLAQLLTTIISSPSDGRTHLYNVAGLSVSVSDLVATFQRIQPEIDMSKLLEYNSNPVPRHGTVDNSRVVRELGFSPVIKLEEGLLDYLTPSPLVGERREVEGAARNAGKGWGEGEQVKL